MRVTLYGAGQVSRNVARVLAGRDGYQVFGPLGRDRRVEALRSGADVVVIATTSFLREVAPDVREAIEAGSNVLTTAEEWAPELEFEQVGVVGGAHQHRLLAQREPAFVLGEHALGERRCLLGLVAAENELWSPAVAARAL